jgi:hypothetical protein
MIIALKVLKVNTLNLVYRNNGVIFFLFGISMTNLENFINANDNKGRDYICSAEGASNPVNLSGKRTLV